MSIYLTDFNLNYITEVFDFYDNLACLFLYKRNDENFLGVLIKEDCLMTQYLLVNLSNSRLQELKQNLIDIYSVFKQSVDSICFKVIDYKNCFINPLIEIVNCQDLKDDDLPQPGYFL